MQNDNLKFFWLYYKDEDVPRITIYLRGTIFNPIYSTLFTIVNISNELDLSCLSAPSEAVKNTFYLKSCYPEYLDWILSLEI